MGRRHRPDDAGFFAWRGELRARRGEFPDAIADLARAADLDPSGHRPWYLLACLRLHAGDAEGYRRAAGAMLARFGRSDSLELVDRTVRVCLLAPGSVPAADLAGALDRVGRAGAAAAELSGGTWLRTNAGVADYYAGRYGDAVAKLTEVRPSLKLHAAAATAEWLLAVAHDRAGHPDRAASLRGSAGRTMANGVPKPGARDLASVSAGPIEDWLVCQIVRREALGAAAGAPVTTRRAAAVAGN